METSSGDVVTGELAELSWRGVHAYRACSGGDGTIYWFGGGDGAEADPFTGLVAVNGRDGTIY